MPPPSATHATTSDLFLPSSLFPPLFSSLLPSPFSPFSSLHINHCCYCTTSCRESTQSSAGYRRRCKIRAPCCNGIFDCKHCIMKQRFDFHFLFSSKVYWRRV
ncbi:hypothetical protein M9H77_07753 [Catharanthus roseus]|uniref:Uncharacterized protein n=1 Tax=Catharanthus roseus TaxID=4058 RepID=A0ACC0BW43_CATRO|nr:hypothetical protein M9H77_07753 [Catharanthus roseus]